MTHCDGQSSTDSLTHEVRAKVVREHLGEAALHAPVAESTEGESETEVGHDDVAEVARVEHRRARLEVVRALAKLLSGRVDDEVDCGRES